MDKIVDTITFGTEFLKELESEIGATRKCLERIPETTYGWKPHEKSMNMGYLTLLVADIPRWITYTIEKSVIDFATFDRFTLSTNSALLKYFDENIDGAKRALMNISNEELAEPFYLKNSGQVLYTTPKKESIQSTLNHWVHHRGQLTVYMRLNNIAVPSIYGPSADDRTF
jgi:uncharacterized damage-inducible protein DinB